jgi:hypothetical protein
MAVNDTMPHSIAGVGAVFVLYEVGAAVFLFDW